MENIKKITNPTRQWARFQEFLVTLPGGNGSISMGLLKHLEQKASTTLVSQVNLQSLEIYQAEMDRQGYKASTRKRKISSIKTFFNFLDRQGFLIDNVTSRLIAPQPQKIEPRFLSKAYIRFSRTFIFGNSAYSWNT